MTLAYFLVASLDLIGALFSDTTEQDRAGWIEWVWDQQLRESDRHLFVGPISADLSTLSSLNQRRADLGAHPSPDRSIAAALQMLRLQ